jgi:hypothetical protein
VQIPCSFAHFSLELFILSPLDVPDYAMANPAAAAEIPAELSSFFPSPLLFFIPKTAPKFGQQVPPLPSPSSLQIQSAKKATMPSPIPNELIVHAKMV